MSKMTMEDLRALAREVATEVAEEHVAPLRQQATDYMSQITRGNGNATPPEDKSLRLGRVVRALAANRGDPIRAASFAENVLGDEVVAKALSASDETAGGFLVRDEFVGSIIELLRPASIVRSLNPVVLPLDSGTLRLPKHTTGASGGWIGENANAPATQPAFGQVVLTAKKYAALIPISNDLLRRASPNVDMVVRDDVVAGIAAATDLAFIRGTGVAGQPRGIRNQSGISTTATAGTTLAQVTTDLGAALQSLMDANVRLLRPGWMMAPRCWRHLATIRDGNGNLAFQPELAAGTLYGFPFAISTQIPTNLGGGTESEVYLVDFADVVIGDATTVLVDASTEAAYHDGTNVVAAFSLDQTVVRAIVEVDLGLRHAESVHVTTAVTWGA
jgi:HK97 family phage major capsid protein